MASMIMAMGGTPFGGPKITGPLGGLDRGYPGGVILGGLGGGPRGPPRGAPPGPRPRRGPPGGTPPEGGPRGVRIYPLWGVL